SISLMNFIREISSPSSRRALMDERKKSEVVTPVISLGYCIPKNRPARARSSTSISNTSSPFSVMLPCVTSYFGCPIIAAAREIGIASCRERGKEKEGRDAVKERRGEHGESHSTTCVER